MSSKEGITIIQNILVKISKHEDINLSCLPLGIISSEQAETLLSWFLNQCAKSTNIKATRIIINAFDIARIRTDPLPAITNIVLNAYLSKEVITFVFSCFPEKTPLDFFVDLINMDNDETAIKAAKILTTIFPNISNKDWDTLMRLTDNVEDEEYHNPGLRAFLQTKVAETGSYCRRPEWIKDDISEPTIRTVPENIPTVKEAVDLLVEDFSKREIICDNEEIGDKIREALISQYSISSVIEKIVMLAPVKKIAVIDDCIVGTNFTINDDVALFQEYGPVNTLYTFNPNLMDSNHECVKYGGCRMLLCSEFETMYSDGEEIDIMTSEPMITDWFRKSCDVCQVKIEKKHYSLREPLRHGGWRGCYCSFECLEKVVNDPYIVEIMNRMKEQLNNIGIREK